MKSLKSLWFRLRKSVKISIEDPKTFKELWSVNSSGLSVISLILVTIVLFSFLILFLFSGTFNDMQKGEVSIEREQLEDQREQIEKLTKQLNDQEQYFFTVRRILNGEVPIDSDLDSLFEADKGTYDSIQKISEKTEKELAEKVREDSKSSQEADGIKMNYFTSPVKGVISQGYNKKTHQGIDVVTKKDEVVKTCLAGTVIYSGYTRKDGYITIIDHSNGFISVYKHNKTILKKTGAQVKMADPIAIVGNTGENTDGPHLHFELWYKQNPVDPEEYIRFTR